MRKASEKKRSYELWIFNKITFTIEVYGVPNTGYETWFLDVFFNGKLIDLATLKKWKRPE